MSEKTESQKTGGKGKGLGRGLGSLLGGTSEGAFSKSTPRTDQALETLTAKMPSQTAAPIKQGFVEAATPSANAAQPAPQPAPAQPAVPAHLRVWHIAIEKISPNPNQPRQHFEKEPLRELADSIREKGIIQPILVRKSESGEYELVAGERRWRAAQLAGLKEVPALIKDLDERQMQELALIENIQREDLNAVEEAEAYDFLIKKFNLTQQEMAQKVGKDRTTVANLLRILQLQPAVRQMVSRGELSLGQAKVLLQVTDPRRQEDLALRCAKEAWSVRTLEKEVARTKVVNTPAGLKLDAREQAAKALGEELQKLLGSKVNLDYTQGKGKVVIHFYSDSELNQIADTLRDSWRN